MTVGLPGKKDGRLLNVIEETTAEEGEFAVKLGERSGRLHPDLNVGANIADVAPLQANSGISTRGVLPHGAGFLLNTEDAALLASSNGREFGSVVRPFRNGRDLTDSPRNVLVIDFFGMTEQEVRAQHPALYQWVLERVKPERDHNPRASRRDRWWLFGETNPMLRRNVAGLARYIATVQTSKHRHFQFLDSAILPDDKLIAIASDDAFLLGVLSSTPHVAWAIAAGGKLGVGNDPVYNKSVCFEAFPCPLATPDQQARIRALAEELDAHRKRAQAASGVTLTQMYNVLEDLRAGRALEPKARAIHDAALVGVLAALHDEIDRAVLTAYGWDDLECRLRSESGREAVLARLVALNALRAAQEAKSEVHWLRPDYQCAAQATPAAEQGGLDLSGQGGLEAPVHAASRAAKIAWPADLPAQVAAVAAVLAQSATALSLDDIAAHFSGRGAWKRRLAQIVDTLVALGRAREAAPLGYVASAG